MLSSNFHVTNAVLGQKIEKKRKLDESIVYNGDFKENGGGICGVVKQCRRNFLEVSAGPHTFQTEDWLEKGGHLYQPVLEDTLINLRNIEKLTITSDINNFVADSAGNYSDTKQGMIINLWRFSEASRKLYISQSLLFADAAVFEDIQKQLSEV